MARIRPTQVAEDDFWEDERPVRRRKAFRYGLPVAVAGVAAATVGLVPALADSGSPDLPKISAEELIAKIATSDTQQLSGSVKIDTDLGFPALPGGGGFGGGSDSAATPTSKLPELAAGGHTLRVAFDGPDRQRVSILEEAAEYSLIRNGDQVWAYDSGSNTAYHATAPKKAPAKRGERPELPKDLKDATPQQLAKRALAAVDDTTEVKVDGTAKVAGRDAYQLAIIPRGDSTIGAVRIAVDADKGVPLKFTVTAKSGGKAAVDVRFTSVDFGKPTARGFEFTPPKGTKVTEQRDLDRAARKHGAGLDKGLPGLDAIGKGKGKGEHPDLKVIGEGWGSVAQLSLPGGGLPTGKHLSGKEAGPAGDLMDSLSSKVEGQFGSGRIFHTRLVNALVTEDGKVFVGAVGKDTLIDAANKAK
ncbi:LolA family protein [Streptomyces palmae]|uniref:Outer membrane lipoprotein carrier protein LolA n=1 Tax=Streptomyces palmae TaxID=1701085 RepID=A0A4Z0HB43_9ACTN|nr:sigma-E factor regulatory protein RseB domain-containing protein [Streptomyces palmae]TGB15932.1 outer membrane lipoprotein carrier protein LolA [Streptomyces palmae]